MSRNPWFKFYSSDWRGDPRLRMCSIGARGLWIELICIMAEAKGRLIVDGKIPTSGQLSALTGVPENELEALLVELAEYGVFSRTRGGVIYSRKMARFERYRAKGRENAQNAPQVKAKKQRENPDRVTKSKTPRIQKPDIEPNGSIHNAKKREQPDEDFDEFWNAYPLKAAKLAGRKAYAKARAKIGKENILDGLERYKRTKPPDQRWAHASSWLNAERWDDGDLGGEPSPRDRPGASEFLLGLAEAGEPDRWPH